jgi:uncharacterized protein involved in exopolysaccharide biosynthesis/Mrp family chromosome partitioning ATPase
MLRPAQPSGFGIEEFVAVLKKHRWLIAKIAGAVMLAATLYAFSQPTIYSASAVVLLDGRKNTVADASAVLTQLQPDLPATIQNQLQIITSRELAEKVIAELGLADDPEFNGSLPATGLAGMADPRNWDGDIAANTDKDKLVDTFLKHIWADANGQSTTITVSANSRDPKKAARIANAVVRAYVADQVGGRHAATSQTTDWLQGRVNDLAAQLQAQNEAIQRFKARNGLADAGPGGSLVDQQMVGINNQIVQARSDLDQKVAQQQSLSGDPASASAVVASPLITQLRTQQATLAQQEADLASRYGPMHPKLVELQAQRRDLEQKIAQEVNRIASSVSGEVNTARSHLQSLQGSLARAEQLSVNQNMARTQLASMEANATSTRTSYETFVTRLRQAQDQDATLTPESRILSNAAVPQSPSAPKRKVIVGASLPLGLMLGAVWALLLERFGYLLRSKSKRRGGIARGRPARALRPGETWAQDGAKDWAKDWEGPPILGELVNTRSLAAADYVIDWPASRFARASAALVRQLEARRGEGAVVALTAPEPGDSKSVVAVAMARAAAAMGKRAVIVDCDPTHRTAAAFHSDPAAGLYEVLTGAVPLNQALVRDPKSGAFLLMLKQRPAQAAAMFASPQMHRLLEILRDSCDLVILDCGLALNGPETALIARQADATLLVSPRARLHGRSLAHATQMLQNAKAAPVGLVLAS